MVASRGGQGVRQSQGGRGSQHLKERTTLETPRGEDVVKGDELYLPGWEVGGSFCRRDRRGTEFQQQEAIIKSISPTPVLDLKVEKKVH